MGWAASPSGARGPDRGLAFDLTLILGETGDGALAGWAEYATALFDPGTIERLTAHLDALLRAAGGTPDAPLSTLSVLCRGRADGCSAPSTPRRARRRRGACTSCSREQAARMPDAVAVVTAAGADLRRAGPRANRLARAPGRGWACGPTRAWRCRWSGPSKWWSAVLAVLKAGGAYVALDPRLSRRARGVHARGLARRRDAHHGARGADAGGDGRGAWCGWTRSAGRSTPDRRRLRGWRVDPDNLRVRDVHLRLHRQPKGAARAAPRAGRPPRRRRTAAGTMRRRARCSSRRSPSTCRPGDLRARWLAGGTASRLARGAALLPARLAASGAPRG